MKRFLVLIAVLAMAVALLPASAVGGATNVRATLDSAQEVPPNASPATGKALVKLHGDKIVFRIFARNMSGPSWGTHIHNAAAGENGPVIVSLCGGPEPNAKAKCGRAKATKFRTQGKITAELAESWGTTIPDLWALIQTGDTYINVHTDAYPGGEIRGQLVP